MEVLIIGIFVLTIGLAHILFRNKFILKNGGRFLKIKLGYPDKREVITNIIVGFVFVIIGLVIGYVGIDMLNSM